MSTTNERVQKVVFVRHGVARHNLLDPETGTSQNLLDSHLLDPPLVYRGKQQALDAGERLRLWWRTTQLGANIELVVTSPLTRCIQTATLAFLPGDCYTSDQWTEPTFICSELCREAFGKHYPDKRRETSVLRVRTSDNSFGVYIRIYYMKRTYCSTYL
jgi:bisphosphoglycerate-dependent phosphoglycerate mutase